MNTLFQKYLSVIWGPTDDTATLIRRALDEISRDADIVALKSNSGWIKIRQRSLLTVSQIDKEVIGLCREPAKNKERINNRLAVREAILGLLNIVETTDRLLANKDKLERELENIANMETPKDLVDLLQYR